MGLTIGGASTATGRPQARLRQRGRGDALHRPQRADLAALTRCSTSPSPILTPPLRALPRWQAGRLTGVTPSDGDLLRVFSRAPACSSLDGLKHGRRAGRGSRPSVARRHRRRQASSPRRGHRGPPGTGSGRRVTTVTTVGYERRSNREHRQRAAIIASQRSCWSAIGFVATAHQPSSPPASSPARKRSEDPVLAELRQMIQA